MSQETSNVKQTPQTILNKYFDNEFEIIKTVGHSYDPNTDTVNPLSVPQGSSLATSEKQDEIVNAIESITIPAPEGGATKEEQTSLEETMNEILAALKTLASTKGVASDIRVTLLGGTTAVTGSLTSAGTVSTVTTVGTVSNITALGGINAYWE